MVMLILIQRQLFGLSVFVLCIPFPRLIAECADLDFVAISRDRDIESEAFTAVHASQSDC